MNFKSTVLRGISGVLLVSLLMTGLAGCIEKEKTAATTKAKKITLVYYKLFDEEDVIAPMIQVYTTKNPNVEIVYKKFTDPVEFENLIINELAEGEGPDIFSAPNSWFLRNVKKISPMPDSKMTTKQFEDTFVTVAKNDLVLRDPADGKSKIYGIPLTVDTLALYFNKATFDDKISSGRPAETWEGIKDNVYKLTKKDQSFEMFELSGIAMGRSDNVARAVDILYMLMLQYKTIFYNDNISQAQFAKQSALNSAGVSLNPSVEALKLYTSFALPANKNYAWNQYLADMKSPVKEMDTFARGKVAMIFGYSYLYDQILTQIKDLKGKGVQTIDPGKVVIAMVPQVNDPKTSTDKRVSYASYYAETVSRTSQNPDVAWDFLVFISGKDNLQQYNLKTHKPTSRRDMIDDQIKDPIYGVFAEQIGFAESFPIYDTVRYSQIFSKAIDAVLATQTATDALRIAEGSINAMLPSGGMIPPVPKETTTTAKTATSKSSTQQTSKTK